MGLYVKKTSTALAVASCLPFFLLFSFGPCFLFSLSSGPSILSSNLLLILAFLAIPAEVLAPNHC
jgi:hypothetical protein